MVNAMEQEMQHEEDWSIGEHRIDVKQKPVKYILEHCPYEISHEEAQEGLNECVDWDA